MAPKKSVAKVAAKRTSVTPKKQAVKSTKASPSSSQPSNKPQRRTSSGTLTSEASLPIRTPVSPPTSLLQEFVKVDQVDFARRPTHSGTDASAAKCLHAEAEKIQTELAEHQATQARYEKAKAELEAAKAQFEKAQADLADTQKSAAKLTADLKLVKLRHELAEQSELRRSASSKHAPLQSANSFEYQTRSRNAPSGGAAHHSLCVSLRQHDKSVGSKDWKALMELADAEKLKALQVHSLPYNVEAEIGPTTGPSHAEPLSSLAAILGKIELLQEEACAYIESSISFKHDANNDPEVIIARRQQFRAYIDLEKDNCEGPFKRVRAWLQDRQKLRLNVAALFVRRNEMLPIKPAVTVLNGDVSVGPDAMQLNGLGVLYLCDDAAGGQMVSLQVKRDYRSAAVM